MTASGRSVVKDWTKVDDGLEWWLSRFSPVMEEDVGSEDREVMMVGLEEEEDEDFRR